MDKQHNCTCPKCNNSCNSIPDPEKLHIIDKNSDLVCRCVNCSEMFYLDRFRKWIEINNFKNVPSIVISDDINWSSYLPASISKKNYNDRFKEVIDYYNSLKMLKNNKIWY